MQTTETHSILDVTILDPRLKHPTIFQRFDELGPGETLEIHNDHDPKPLYYQMLGERGKIFEWKYMEEGPVWWKVRITKTKPATEDDKSIGEILSKDIRKALVFKKYGIDFCCGGKKTISQVCEEKGIDQGKLEQELVQASQQQSGRALEYDSWGLDFLADYIVQTHHSYVNKMMPELRVYATKVARVHGAHHPELIPILENVELVIDELTHHMQKEEGILFPYIKGLVAVSKGIQSLRPSSFGTVKNPIQMMEVEHDLAGNLFEEINSLSNQYTLPADACASYTLLYRLLKEFEEDLHMHIHLENNILFPKAIELEKGLEKSSL